MGLVTRLRSSFCNFVTPNLHRHCNIDTRRPRGQRVLWGLCGKNEVLPARLELAIFGLLLEFQAHTDYETDALPTEPRKHYEKIGGL